MRAMPVDQLVDQDMIPGLQAGFHGSRRNLESLDQEGPAENGQKGGENGAEKELSEQMAARGALLLPSSSFPALYRIRRNDRSHRVLVKNPPRVFRI